MVTGAHDSAGPVILSRLYEAGLTKREYFAAIAMQGILASCYINGSTERITGMDIAKDAVNMADTLINHLNKVDEVS